MGGHFWNVPAGVRPFTLLLHHNGRDGVPNHQPQDCLLTRLFRRRSKKTSKLRVTGLCAGNSPMAGEFPAQMASTAENVSIWRRPHEPPPFAGRWLSKVSTVQKVNHKKLSRYRRYDFYTVETLYNTVNFCWSTHKRHSIARPKGRGMGCLLWVQMATYCVDLSKLSSIKY